jgi:nucleotide-binding universal stress UspA family protein
MEIRSILVDVGANRATPILSAGIDLAKRFGAELIGFAAAEPSSSTIVVEGGAVVTTWYEQERAAIETALQGLEANFLSSMPGDVRSSWRAFIDNPTETLIGTARSADVILTPSTRGIRQADLGELALRSGRPLIMLADGADRLRTDRIVLAWKDTREARRAASDALPLLRAAKEVIVTTVLEGDQGAARAVLADVIRWLELHDVTARQEVLPLTTTAGDTLISSALAADADLIVSGAYGHSRFREWLFGGMTNELLQVTTISRFLAS